MAGRYFVIVYSGIAHPEYVESFGPFDGVEVAIDAYVQRGLGGTPTDGQWATVIPDPARKG